MVLLATQIGWHGIYGRSGISDRYSEIISYNLNHYFALNLKQIPPSLSTTAKAENPSLQTPSAPCSEASQM